MSTKLDEVIDKVLRDPVFAAQLSVQARDAQRKGVGTGEWVELMKHFARNEKELARLKTLSPTPSCPDCTTPTRLTLTTVSSAACVITTTTTTMTYFIPKPKGTYRAGAKPKAGSKKRY